MARAGLRLSAAAAALACVGLLSLAMQPGAFVSGAAPAARGMVGSPAGVSAPRAAFRTTAAPAPAAGSGIDVLRCGVCAALLLGASTASSALRRSKRASRPALRSCAVALSAPTPAPVSLAPAALPPRAVATETPASGDLLDLSAASAPVIAAPASFVLEEAAPATFVVAARAIAAEPEVKSPEVERAVRNRGVEARVIGGTRYSKSRSQSRGSERTARRAVGAKLQGPTVSEMPTPPFDMSKIRMKIQSSLRLPSSVSVQGGREAKTPSTGQTSELNLGLRIQANMRE